MAAGDLSADQRRYRDALVAATGLDPTVAVAWIGAESGWSVTKSDHNYLNIGPGRRYSSATSGAAAAAGLINESDYYGGIREAIASGLPAAQITAIYLSPWDAGHYGGDGSRLVNVYEQISGDTVGGPLDITDLQGPIAGTARDVADSARDLAGVIGNPAGAVRDAITGILSGGALRDLVVRGTLTVALLAISGVLVVLGVLRMTRVDNRALDAVLNLGGLVATRGATA